MNPADFCQWWNILAGDPATTFVITSMVVVPGFSSWLRQTVYPLIYIIMYHTRKYTLLYTLYHLQFDTIVIYSLSLSIYIYIDKSYILLNTIHGFLIYIYYIYIHNRSTYLYLYIYVYVYIYIYIYMYINMIAKVLCNKYNNY